MTLGTGMAEFPLWSPDGKEIIFTFGHNALRRKLASGEGDEREILKVETGGIVMATGWSPDGRFVTATLAAGGAKSLDVVMLPLDTLKPVRILDTGFTEEQGRFSPDGRWLAYVSNQSGVNEVYVRGVATDVASRPVLTGGRVLVSRGGGTAPRWRGDGRELFFLAPSGTMMAVSATAGPEFKAGTPTPLFQAPPGAVVGDVTADGKRFLLVTPVGPTAAVPFTVVLNWTAGLNH